MISPAPHSSPAEPSILLVDDDVTFSGALSGALTRRGFVVSTAVDYDAAIAAAQHTAFARAVVDLRMPGRGGLEVVAELHRLLPKADIIVLTGYGSIATAVEAIKLGAMQYLTKPASADEILAAFARRAPTTDLEDAPATVAKPLEEVEWEHLQKVLTECGGNISEAARRLGMHRRSLQRKLARGRPDEAE